MDIKEYSYVLAIKKYRSITEAAKFLNITQPALSLYLRSLEERIGQKLFYKAENALHLTKAGERYVHYGEKIVALDEALGRELREFVNLDRGEVVLGVTAIRGMHLLQKLLPRFKAKYPGINIKIKEGTSQELEDMTITRQIDIAVFNQPSRKCELDWEVLATDDIVVTVPDQFPVHEFVQKNSKSELPWIDIKHLRDYPFILLQKGQRMRQIADALFKKSGFAPQILWELSNAVTAYDLSASGLGLSIVTADFCRKRAGKDVRYYAIGNPPLVYNVVAAYAKKTSFSHAAEALMKIIKETYRDL